MAVATSIDAEEESPTEGNGSIVKKVAAHYFIAVLLHGKSNARLVIAPVKVAVCVEIVYLKRNSVADGGRGKVYFVRSVFTRNHRRAQIKSSRKNFSAAIIDVLADKVYSARRGKNAKLFFVAAVNVCKTFLSSLVVTGFLLFLFLITKTSVEIR